MPRDGCSPTDLWESVRSSRPASVEELLEESRKRREAYQGGIQRLQHAAIQFAWVAGPVFLLFNVPRMLFGRRRKRPTPPDAGAGRVVPGSRPGQQQQGQMNPEDQKEYLAQLMKQREEYMKKMQEAQLKAKLEARKAFLEKQAQPEKETQAKVAQPAALGEAAAAGTAFVKSAAAAPAKAAPKGLSGGLPAKPASAAAAAAASSAGGPRGLGAAGGLLPRGPAKPAPTTVIEDVTEPNPAPEPKGLGKGPGLGLAPRKTTPTKPKAPAGFGSKPMGLRGGLPPRGRVAQVEEDDDEDEWEEDDGTADEAVEEEGKAAAPEETPAASAPVQPEPVPAPDPDPIKNFKFSGATADAVPLPDGSGWLVRRKMAADNSCLFNAVDYVKYGYKYSAGPAHTANQYGMQLRLVVANEVEDRPHKFNEAFLSMPNHQYVKWIQDPANWGGGIELSILAEHFKIEIGALNVRSKTCHVFGEESGYTQRALLIYDGNHYDAIAVAASPSAPQLKDEALFDPTSPHGKSVMAAAQKMAELSWEMKNMMGAPASLMSLFGGSA